MTVFPPQAALDYDERIDNLVPGYTLALELFGCVLADRIDPQGSVLVVGCGTGSEILALAKTFPQTRFTAVEPSFAMLEKAKKRLSKAGIDNRVDFINGFVADVPQQLHVAATASLVLHFLPDDGSKITFLKQINQRLQHQAPLLLLDPPQLKEDILLQRWLEARGHKPTAAQSICQLMATKWHRISPERLNERLQQSGFNSSKTFLSTPGYQALIAEKQANE